MSQAVRSCSRLREWFGGRPSSRFSGLLNFGQVQIGTTSASFPVTLEDTGTTAIAIGGVSVTPFNLAGNACGASLGANSACALTLTFAPTQTGTATGTLTIKDDAGIQRLLH